MENKNKAKARAVYLIAGLAILAILANYTLSEFVSIHGNPIKRVYVKDALVKAEVVKSPEKIELGLGGRAGLSEGRGMLFEVPKSGTQRFWMKGMRFAIDIIWIESGRVTGCEKNISPDDQRIFTSPGSAGYVLEVPEGFCDRYNLGLNDKVRI